MTRKTRGLRAVRLRFHQLWQILWEYASWPASLARTVVRRSGRVACKWWASRHSRHLMQGLPALLLGMAVAVLACLLGQTPESDLLWRYPHEAARAWQEGNYHAAQVCYERLALAHEGRPEYEYSLALTDLALGQEGRALALLNNLAASDRQGYPPAHLWHARRLLDAKASPQALHAAELHLLRALQGQPELREAHPLLGQLYLATNRLNLAEPHLLKAVPAQPELRLPLAGLYARRGQKEQARSQAEQAARFFRQQAEADVDNHQARSLWAEAALLQEDFRGALAILEDGMKIAARPPYRQALARVCVTWADALAANPKANPADLFVLLELALKYDNANEAALQHLLAFTKLRGAEGDKARKALQALLAQAKTPAILHLLLGIDAWERGKTDESRRHLEQAYQLNPDMGLIANNLAWVLAYGNPADLRRALELINSALQRWPHQPRLRDTRGHILVKMGRWKEALTDLEAALPEVSDKRASHRTLADVYQHLGMPEMAAEHKRLARDKSP